MSVVIPVRVPRELAEKINQLVKVGLYSSRSNLMREAIRRFAASEHAFTSKIMDRQLIATLASSIIAWNEKTIADIILFGSTARGEARTESDVDLPILTEEAHPWKVRQRLYDFSHTLN